MKLDVECDNQVPETTFGVEVVCDLISSRCLLSEIGKLDGVPRNDALCDIPVVCDL